MTVRRPIQGSFIEGMEHPCGPILQSVYAGTNSQLIAAVAPLYLAGSVLDVTYGQGKWWNNYTPNPFAYHDLALDGVDCRHLPEDDNSYNTVCYDPPYVEAGTPGSASGIDFFGRFGIGSGRPLGTILTLIAEGTREACRVADRFVLVKCMEYVAGAKFHDGPAAALLGAEAAGWIKHDQIVHHTGGGLGGAHRTYQILRAARAHSYLIVFAPPTARWHAGRRTGRP